MVDAQEVVTAGLRSGLARHEWVEGCVQATDAPRALTLARRYRPDVALVDAALDGDSGARLCERIRRVLPAAQVLLMSAAEPLAPPALQRAGACGQVSKRWRLDEIVAATLAAGLRAVVSAAPPSPARGERGDRSLTPREREVLVLMATGATNAEIAHELSLSLYTIKQHAQAAYRKLHARNRTDAVQRAGRLGLL